MNVPESDQWHNPEAYAYTEALSLSQWAWQFLRRNPDYHSDWQWFWPLWQSLEQEYGSPPERDFPSWKKDARAWREQDGEALLIECWMGQRWGFYKFPLDPSITAPGIELVWRPTDNHIKRLSAGDHDYLTDRQEHIALGFELDCPLAEQLQTARQYLLTLQRSRQKKGLLRPPKLSAWREHWIRLIRLLDALEEGAQQALVLDTLYPEENNDNNSNKLFEHDTRQARLLRDRDYRTILKYLDNDQDK